MSLFDIPLTPTLGSVSPIRGLGRGRHSSLVDRAPGGTALSDISAGLAVKSWTLRGVQAGASWEARISAEGEPETVLFTRSGTVKEVALAFTQNMSPVVVFADATSNWIWWYDNASYVFTDLGAGRDFRANLNRLVGAQIPESDIVVTYINPTHKLCARYQRESYATEHELLQLTARHRNLAVYVCTGCKLVYKIEGPAL